MKSASTQKRRNKKSAAKRDRQTATLRKATEQTRAPESEISKKEREREEILELRRQEYHAPRMEMIARGKDSAEAAILFRMMKAVDEINFEFDDPYDEKNLSKKKRTKLQSLLWNAEQVLQWIVAGEETGSFGSLHPKRRDYDPEFAAYWKRIRANVFDVSWTLGDIIFHIEAAIREKRLTPQSGHAKLLRKDCGKLGSLIEAAIEDKAQLFLTIGFALGLRVLKHDIEAKLGAIKLDAIERYTIKKPEPSAEEEL